MMGHEEARYGGGPGMYWKTHGESIGPKVIFGLGPSRARPVDWLVAATRRRRVAATADSSRRACMPLVRGREGGGARLTRHTAKRRNAVSGARLARK